MSGGFAGVGIWTHPETVGEVACPCCGGLAPVRRNKRGKFYVYCAPGDDRGEGCGMLTPNLPGGQAWIMDHAHLYTAGETPAPLRRMAEEIAAPPAARTPEKPAPKTRPSAPAPAAKPAGNPVNEKSPVLAGRRGLFGGLLK